MTRVPGMVTSVMPLALSRRSRSVGGTGAMKSTSPARSAATRVGPSLIGRMTMRVTLPGEAVSQ